MGASAAEHPHFYEYFDISNKNLRGSGGAPQIKQVLTPVMGNYAYRFGTIKTNDSIEKGALKGNITPMSSDLTDAKIAASEARAETKISDLKGDVRAGFADLAGEIKAMRSEMTGEIKAMRAEMGGRFDSLATRLDHVEKQTSGLRWNIWSSVLVIAGLIVALITFSGSQVGLGLNFSGQIQDAIKAIVSGQTQTPPPSEAP